MGFYIILINSVTAVTSLWHTLDCLHGCLLTTGFSGFPQLCSITFLSFFFVLGILSIFFSIVIFSNVFLGIHVSCTVECNSFIFSIDCNHIFLCILYIPLFTFNVICLRTHNRTSFGWKAYFLLRHITLKVNKGI